MSQKSEIASCAARASSGMILIVWTLLEALYAFCDGHAYQ